MHRTLPFLAALVALSGCEGSAQMTRTEALEALGEYANSGRGEAATTEPIEVSTTFTIGQAVEAAAEQLAAFWESQQPCNTVTWTGATVTIDYGGLADSCDFMGHTYGGVTIVSVDSAAVGELAVTHTWQAMNNGDVQVDGGALVTWDGVDETRHVTTEHTWTDLADGTTVDVEGDHVWGYLDPNLKFLGGYTLDGTRDWHAESGDWHMDMAGLEIRLQDPVPQAGLITLTNPAGKELDITSVRIDEATIRVTLSTAYEDWVFDINQLGVPSEVTETSATGA